ncbi:DUF5330 domain-containing protein [Allorhizobium sp. BGMRC 0089]|uniref:DUF5330 domain-containing protein n=1 Tax=Allorhizobium sonneratiae TaxID=2934936 RepID=UPI00203343B0|nr:DUF5330 domain-containing protein [Allorhizobium sonneratiae]MCM2293508.1 DUF5330 domain-containing protein [Allorhizobium sonneratiae]
MWFLIKGAFWFTLVLVLLSFLGGGKDANTAQEAKFDPQTAIAAASGLYDYLGGLCQQKPDVCVKGAETLSAIGQRASEGAKVAYEILNRQFGDKPVQTKQQAGQAAGAVDAASDAHQTAGSDPLVTASVREPLRISVPIPRPKPEG